MTVISPSLLAADFSQLKNELDSIEKAGAEWIHLDVMDGMFVPNISFGIPVIAALRPVTPLVFDVHLMIEEPIRYIDAFKKAGAEWLTVHVEACGDIKGTLRAIRAAGMKAGLSVKPGTPAQDIVPYLGDVDLVLVMSVEPGFGGQKFMPDMLEKVEFFRRCRAENGYGYLIEIDGGVGAGNARACTDAGCDVLVAGSAVFGKADRAAAVAALRA